MLDGTGSLSDIRAITLSASRCSHYPYLVWCPSRCVAVKEEPHHHAQTLCTLQANATITSVWKVEYKGEKWYRSEKGWVLKRIGSLHFLHKATRPVFSISLDVEACPVRIQPSMTCAISRKEIDSRIFPKRKMVEESGYVWYQLNEEEWVEACWLEEVPNLSLRLSLLLTLWWDKLRVIHNMPILPVQSIQTIMFLALLTDSQIPTIGKEIPKKKKSRRTKRDLVEATLNEMGMHQDAEECIIG